MIEIPIEYACPGDSLGRNQSFKKFDGGMSSTVDLMKGYKLTGRVLEKLKQEYKVRALYIQDSLGQADLEAEEGFDETTRQHIVDMFHENVSEIHSSKIIDMHELEKIVHDIMDNVSTAIKSGSGCFKTLSRAFHEVQSHDSYTWEHSVNSAIYAAIIGLSVPAAIEKTKKHPFPASFNSLEILIFNMLLHDVGKIRVPLEVLNKRDSFSEKDYEIIMKHPYSGLVYMRKINQQLLSKNMTQIPSYFMKACLLHHQAYDGSGYPALRISGWKDIRPLKGNEISPVGRVAAVADMFDALSSNRPYRLPLHPADALKLVKSERGIKLDPAVADILLKRISPFPIGSTVILSTGELAAVTGHVGENTFCPIVRPYLRKIKRDGKEQIIRLQNRKPIGITPSSKVRIVINKDLYQT